MAKRQYRRTAALLGAQPQAARRQRARLRVHVPWRWVALASVIVGLLLWLWLDPSWYVDASRLKIAGTGSLETVRDIALAAEVLTLHRFWIRPNQVVSQVVHTVPAVTDVRINCRLYPADCLLTVDEREAVLHWQTGEQLWAVDVEGVIFRATDPAADVPTIRGPLPETERVSADVLAGIEALLVRGVPAAELTYHAGRGLVWHHPEGTRVAFGVGEDMGLRWRTYQAIMLDLRERGILPQTLDVRFPEAVTYSLEGSW